VAGTSTSIIAGTPTSTIISIVANTKVETGDREVDLNIGQSTARAFLIAINRRRKNSTELVPTMRLSHGSSFADEPNRGDRILVQAD